MIKTLTLTNFRKHEKLELDFTAGLNGIFGANYRGKSTVLYGILFALGGVRAIPCSTVLREGASTYKVDLTFFAGDDYRVVRTKSTDRLYKGLADSDENLIANGTTVVNKKIEEILGMTMKRFLQTRFAQQKKTHAILLTGANELYAVINEISGADTVEAALKLLGDKVKSLDGFLDRVEMPDVAAHEEALENVIATLTEKVTEKEMWQGMTEQHKVDLEAARNALLALQQAEKVFNAYDSDLRHAMEDVRRAQQGVENASAAATELDASYPELEVELTEAIAGLTAALTEASGVQMLLDAQQKDLGEIKTKLAAAEEKLANLTPVADPQVDHAALDLDVGILGEKQAELTLINSEIRTLESEKLEPACKTCGRAWEDHEEKQLRHTTLMTSLESRREKLRGEVATLRESTESRGTLVAHYELAKSSFTRDSESLTQSVNGFKTRKEQVESDIERNEVRMRELCPDGRDSLVFQRTDLEGQLTVVQRALRRAEQDRQDIERAKQREAEAKEKLEAVLALERPEFSAADLVKATNVERALSDSHLQASTALTASTEQCRALTERKESLEESIPKVKEQAAKIATAEAQRSVNKNLTKFLKSNRDRFMADVWTILMAQASQFVQQCTAGAIESIMRTDDGDFAYTEDGRTLSITEASGAQASIMGLAVQLALASAVQPPLDVLLVDEPNADMDPEHSLAVNLLLSATVGQVICVSHSHMDSSVCENVIEL